MAKHPRKKQKVAATNDVLPLGAARALENDEDKDDEERRLESVLFGKPFKPSGKKSKEDVLEVRVDEEDDNGDIHGGGNEMEQLKDADLFFVDGGGPDVLDDMPDVWVDVSDDTSHHEDGLEDHATSPASSDEDSEDGNESSNDGPNDKGEGASHPPPTAQIPLTKTRRPAAWADPDDSSLQVSLESDKRLRKLRDAPTESVVGGAQYEAKLRREYERINPAPNWASKARMKLHPKRRRSTLEDEGDASGDGEAGLDDILTSTNGIIETDRRSTLLAKGTLAIERLRDANQAAKAEGEIKALEFHPSPKVPILFTASTDRRLRLFNVDGHTNPHLQTIHIPSLPISKAMFHPNGSSILLTGPRPFYYIYDLQSGSTTRSPRGLWGTTFANANSSKQGDMSMEICAFDPSGEVLAVAGRRGYVHLIDWKSGAGQVVGSVKMNNAVKSLVWTHGSGRSELMTLGDDAEVYVWNVGERRCVRRWKDDGGFGSVVMEGDNADRYLSVGSKSGLVNVYGSDSFSSTSSATPKPLKTLGNLTTSISTLRFNRDSQLLAMASSAKKDQMRLIHLPSLTAFSNWPTSSTPLGHVTAIDFSAGTEYVAVGNNRGRVLLYHLPHFINQ